VLPSAIRSHFGHQEAVIPYICRPCWFITVSKRPPLDPVLNQLNRAELHDLRHIAICRLTVRFPSGLPTKAWNLSSPIPPSSPPSNSCYNSRSYSLFNNSYSIWYRGRRISYLCNILQPFVTYFISIKCKYGASGNVVSWGTMLLAGRSRVLFPMRSSDFSVGPKLPTALWP
jgi:hypothetical protein